LVSKVAARRDDVGAVLPFDDPDQLRAGIEDNLAALGVEQITAVNLRVMDNAVPDERFVEQLGALVAARDEGLIAGIGISNVTHRHLLRALEVTEIVCVQNAYKPGGSFLYSGPQRMHHPRHRVRSVLPAGLAEEAA